MTIEKLDQFINEIKKGASEEQINKMVDYIKNNNMPNDINTLPLIIKKLVDILYCIKDSKQDNGTKEYIYDWLLFKLNHYLERINPSQYKEVNFSNEDLKFLINFNKEYIIRSIIRFDNKRIVDDLDLFLYIVNNHAFQSYFKDHYCRYDSKFYLYAGYYYVLSDPNYLKMVDSDVFRNPSVDTLSYLIYILEKQKKVYIPKPYHYDDNFGDFYRRNRLFLKPKGKREKALINEIIKIIPTFIPKKKNIENDTSLIRFNDKLFINEENKLSIQPQNFDLIKEQSESDTINYGEFPLKNADTLESNILDILYENKQLKVITSSFYYIKDGIYYALPVFEINNEKFIRIKDEGKKYKWIKFVPIKWKINDLTGSLDMIDKIELVSNDSSDHFMRSGFKKDVFVIYQISKEEEEREKELKKNEEIRLSKFKIEEKKKEEEKRKKQLKEQYDNVLSLLNQLNTAVDAMNNSLVTNGIKIKNKVKIPREVLIIKVDDHFEFNPDYLPFLKYIDLSLVDSNNLKIQGINFRGTNIVINPQLVYNKDLSYCTFDNNNIIFGNFSGCNLSGTDIENEVESLLIEDVITDDNTKLPINAVIDDRI